MRCEFHYCLANVQELFEIRTTVTELETIRAGDRLLTLLEGLNRNILVKTIEYVRLTDFWINCTVQYQMPIST
jgi:hypothetical protein